MAAPGSKRISGMKRQLGLLQPRRPSGTTGKIHSKDHRLDAGTLGLTGSPGETFRSTSPRLRRHTAADGGRR
ncbi:hypothetical protein NHX12_033169 [Muraenolepis orangiensis]|uniref:Uncharacterized protein n=1 Tax=Muraenolepis orangiensis TaxID=630683 RepID=A0A9Q0E4L0_9TELE|nr:hypothetical protein NHX12_033169 [Muraenolepis orangiensis]